MAMGRPLFDRHVWFLESIHNCSGDEGFSSFEHLTDAASMVGLHEWMVRGTTPA